MRKILLSSFLLLLTTFTYAGNNDIYITQTGTGLTLTIDQIGATNKVGTAANARVTLSGTTMTMDIDQIGDSNSFLGSFLQGNNTSWTFKNTGDSSAGLFNVGASGDVAGTDFDYTTVGDSTTFTFTQGASAAATSGNQDFVISGTSNTYTGICEVVGCINNWDIDGNSNQITTQQTGSANHAITVDLNGASNTVTVHQTDTSSTNVLNLIATTSSGTIDVDQCASGC